MELERTADTTTLSYWLNWRVFLCAIWVLTPMVLALLIIRKYEGQPNNSLKSDTGNQPLSDSNEAWRPCLKQIHPAWLLGFRIFAFFLLLATLIYKVVISGGRTFFYYTQWTFTLLTIYFGCGSVLSAYGCYQYIKLSRSSVCDVEIDAEDRGSYLPLMCEEGANGVRKRNISCPPKENSVYRLPRILNYVFEVIFQMNAGAVLLTDSVYWFIIFPLLTIQDYNLTFLTVDMHSVNVILLLGEAALNCLRVPFFRISFFVLWTGVFVIFQWIFHACVSIWWPYPFLDLESPYAPLWYLLIGIMHIPCYGIFVLTVEMKHYLLAKWFPSSVSVNDS